MKRQIDEQRYTAPAMVVHWLMALMLLVSFCVGLYMAGLPFSPQRIRLFNWHKWAGITILAVASFRLYWRLTHKPPDEPVMPVWQRRASRVAHSLLYVLFFAVPLAGWAYSSAAGVPLVLFGVLPLPNLVPESKAASELLKSLHGTLAWSLAVVACVHVAAALKHHFIDHDKLLLRMIPRWSAKDST